MFSSFFSVLFYERGIKTQCKMNFPVIYNIKKKKTMIFPNNWQDWGNTVFLKYSDGIAINIQLQITERNDLYEKYFTCI